MLTGHACVEANTCFDCGGHLRDERGTFGEYVYEDSRVAFAAPVCHYCKRVHVMRRRSRAVPIKYAERIAELEANSDAMHHRKVWVAFLWSKTVINKDADRIVDRYYVVNFDGSISTCKYVFDLNRSIKSKQTEGWQDYKPKNVKIKNIKHAFEVVSTALEPQGYRREI